jgi:hypothetical protein
MAGGLPAGEVKEVAHINLDHLRELEDNWDNDEAVAPTREAVDLAESILNTPAKVFPRHNGGVQIEWHCEGADIEIYITPDAVLEMER